MIKALGLSILALAAPQLTLLQRRVATCGQGGVGADPQQDRALALSADGLTFWTATERGVVRQWEVDSGLALRALRVDGKARSLAVAPAGPGLAAGLESGQVLWWTDLAQPPRSARVGSGIVFRLRYSADGRRLHALSWDKQVRTFDVATGAEVSPARQVADPYTARLNPSGAIAEVNVKTGEVSVQDAGGQLLLRQVVSGAASVDLSWDGALVAVGLRSNGGRILQTRGGGPRASFATPASQVLFSAKELLASDLLGAVTRIDPLTGAVLGAASCSGESLSPSADGRMAAYWGTARVAFCAVDGGPTYAQLPRGAVAAISNDGRSAVSADWELTWFRLPDPTAARRAELDGKVFELAIAPDGSTWVGFSDGRIQRWAADGTSAMLEPGVGPLGGFVFSRDGKRGAADGKHAVQLWEIPSGKTRQVCLGQWDVDAVALSPDGSAVLCSHGETLQLEDWSGSGAPWTFGLGVKDIRGLAFSPSGDRFLAAGDGRAAVFDARRRALVKEVQVPWETAVRWMAEDAFAVAAAHRLQVITLGKPDGPMREYPAALVELSPNGAFALIRQPALRTWEALSLMDPARSWKPLYADDTAVEVLRGGGPSGLVVKRASGASYRCDPRTGALRPLPEAMVPGADGSSSDGSVTLQNDGTLLPQDSSTRLGSLSFRLPLGALDRNGSVIAGANDEGAWVWERATGKKLWSDPEREPATSLALSPDGKWSAIGSKGGTRLVELATGKTTPVSSAPAAAKALAFSPDGTLLATASPAGAVQIWSIPAGRLADTVLLDPETDAATALAFGPERSLWIGTSRGVTAKVSIMAR